MLDFSESDQDSLGFLLGSVVLFVGCQVCPSESSENPDFLGRTNLGCPFLIHRQFDQMRYTALVYTSEKGCFHLKEQLC